MFVAAVAMCVAAAAIFASWLPLPVSIVTVFLFAGPHNWFGFRYFLMRLPARFGRSRTFFLTAFIGLAGLTISYVSLPFAYEAFAASSETWLIVLAIWNTLMLAWLVALVQLRAKQKRAGIVESQQTFGSSQRTFDSSRRTADWSWAVPVALALAALNWLAPDFFSLALVYVHPLVALWFLDRHLKKTRPGWVGLYRRCLCLLPLVLALMIWRLSATTPLADDNGLFWRITQHSGAQLLPQLSSHMLVSVHLFLEMLHYGVWIFALPLLGPGFWDFGLKPKGFSRKALLVVGVIAVVVLWVGFTADYTKTRDLYFTIAIAHVLAEAPFLLRML